MAKKKKGKIKKAKARVTTAKAKKAKAKKATVRKKKKKKEEEKEDTTCQMCWEKPQADPPIWYNERVGSKPIDRLVCLTCAVDIGKSWLPPIPDDEELSD